MGTGTMVPGNEPVNLDVEHGGHGSDCIVEYDYHLDSEYDSDSYSDSDSDASFVDAEGFLHRLHQESGDNFYYQYDDNRGYSYDGYENSDVDDQSLWEDQTHWEDADVPEVPEVPDVLDVPDVLGEESRDNLRGTNPTGKCTHSSSMLSTFISLSIPIEDTHFFINLRSVPVPQQATEASRSESIPREATRQDIGGTSLPEPESEADQEQEQEPQPQPQQNAGEQESEGWPDDQSENNASILETQETQETNARRWRSRRVLAQYRHRQSLIRQLNSHPYVTRTMPVTYIVTGDETTYNRGSGRP